MQKKNPLTRDRIAHGLALKTGVELQHARRYVDEFIRMLGTALETGEGIDLRGFCTMRVGMRQGRQGRNPRTGEAVAIAARKGVRFRLSKNVKL